VPTLNSLAQETIDITVIGISDGIKNSRQRDRQEAMTDAKRQACEKAGLKIGSKTRVENFQTTYDLIESKSEAILLPGFNVIDIGYVEDGTYQVVLSGKIKTNILDSIAKLYFMFDGAAWYVETFKNDALNEEIFGMLISAAPYGAKFTIDDKELYYYKDQLVTIHYSKKTVAKKYSFSETLVYVKMYVIEYQVPHGSIFKDNLHPRTFLENNKTYVKMTDGVELLSFREINFEHKYFGRFPDDYECSYKKNSN
jgi:hypothetical protein